MDAITREFYTEGIATKKTTASKKAFCTRQITALKDYLIDLTEAYHSKSGMLHGEFITFHKIKETREELVFVTELRASL